MGNTSGKQQSYQQYYESMNDAKKTGNGSHISEDIELSGLDPYKVLNVPKNFTWEQLKKGYKHAALKTHPDKEGGNKVIFDFNRYFLIIQYRHYYIKILYSFHLIVMFYK